MRAALTQPGTHELVIDDIDIDDPGPGQVRVRVHFCGVCHSDAGFRGSTHIAGQIVLGHEAAGIVDAIGPGVTAVSPGDKVVMTPAVPCGHCYFCLRGDFTLCVDHTEGYTATFVDGTTGLSRRGERIYRGLGVGGFAEYALTHEYGAIKVPDDTPLDVACVLGCAVQTGVGAVLNTAKVEPGATVLVTGLGGVGLSVVQGARAAGASRIIACDLVESRRDAALEVGATDVIDPDEHEIVEVVRDLTSVGVDYAFEAAGHGRLADLAIQATRPGGTIVLVGAAPHDHALTIQPIIRFSITEKKLTGTNLGSCNSARDIPRFLAMWRAGQLDLEALVTHRRPLAEINDAFADLESGIGIRTAIDLRSCTSTH
jgi:S-(hydroxymethyl)glutathione dehydrogenase/alcohol dehydrogenase